MYSISATLLPDTHLGPGIRDSQGRCNTSSEQSTLNLGARCCRRGRRDSYPRVQVHVLVRSMLCHDAEPTRLLDAFEKASQSPPEAREPELDRVLESTGFDIPAAKDGARSSVPLCTRLLFAQAGLDLCMSNAKSHRDHKAPGRYDFPIPPGLLEMVTTSFRRHHILRHTFAAYPPRVSSPPARPPRHPGMVAPATAEASLCARSFLGKQSRQARFRDSQSLQWLQHFDDPDFPRSAP